MDMLLRKHWTSLLGVLFVLAAFITLFKYSIEQGWITDGMKIAAGLLSGAGLCIAGQAMTGRGSILTLPFRGRIPSTTGSAFSTSARATSSTPSEGSG